MTDKCKPITVAPEFVYSQSKGVMWFRNKNDELSRIGKGYSGQRPYINEPSAEGLVAQGPLPRGTYRMSWPWHHVRLGPQCIFLEPSDETNMLGRSGFFIHGDNSFGNQSASNGCIIMSRRIRDAIAEQFRVTRKLTVIK